MLEHWIWLATRPGLGPRSALAILQHFSDPEAAYYADPDSYKLVRGLEGRDLSGLTNKDLSGAEKILTDCYNKQIHLLTYQDAAYPARLRNIPDPPMVLYYVGTLPNFDGEAVVGVVGTRKASPYGLVCAKRLGYQISRCGGIVVSGLAGGIDSMAMTGALTAGSPVVGVLGNGVDIVYPRWNGDLYRDTAQWGCLISEYPPGTPPDARNFPRRNRIISGLSLGVLVVEAPDKSGALITAGQALEQGRDVFAVPGNIDTPNSVGTNRLISQGALVVQCGWDVMQEYAPLFPGKLHPYNGGVRIDLGKDEARIYEGTAPYPISTKEESKIPEEKKSIDIPEKKPYIDLNEIRPQLSEDERVIVDALSKGQLHVDDVIDMTGLPAARVLASMTLLEVKGLICRLPGKYIDLARKEL